MAIRHRDEMCQSLKCPKGVVSLKGKQAELFIDGIPVCGCQLRRFPA